MASMPASSPLSPATAATLVAQSSALLKVQMAIAAGRMVGGAGAVHSRSVMVTGPPIAVHSIHNAPPSTYSFSGAVSTTVPVLSTSALSMVLAPPRMSEPAKQHPCVRRRVEDQLQLDFIDGGPSLEIARRQPAEVGVGVDGRALFQVQRVALPVCPAVDDARVHIVGHLRARAGEQAACHDEPLGCGVLGERPLQRVGGRLARLGRPALSHAAPTA